MLIAFIRQSRRRKVFVVVVQRLSLTVFYSEQAGGLHYGNINPNPHIETGFLTLSLPPKC